MRKPVKHDTSAKNKKSYSVKNNAAVNPFVLVSILAAIAVVVWVIIFFALRMYNH
ncbi:MAG TPA: hypothetical protein VG738_21005 [Chitinophagaceae bacterium]|nr:hypothetical protein [Chitinophagaceae bacterium]